ncbi:MAG: DUF4838 domain-containing protein [Pirellulales bacterium]|nr:DUF4838 domain-containing protein [Pirellulales bacterium]
MNHGVDLATGAFDGLGAYIEAPNTESLKLGAGDFAISAWVHTEEQVDDVIGDVIDMYDPAARRGITLSINSTAGGFQSQGTDRHVYFGIDDAKTGEWQDCGRPSASCNYVSESMTVFKGKLYAATTGGTNESDWRRVYRYDGGQSWTDCGQVGDGRAQGVGPLIVHNGDLYAVTWTVDWTRVKSGDYDAGRVYRYLGGTQWEECGQPSDNCTLNCIASFRGKLYVGGGPETWGVFTQEGPDQWKPSTIFPKEGPRRCFPHSMAVFNRKLFTCYPFVYAFDGHEWTYAGRPVAANLDRLQLYCFAVHQGKLCVGTWPEGRVAAYQGGEDWQDIGRVGEDGTEPNGLVVYNGKLYGGTLPRAEVCRYDGDSRWTSLRRFYSPDGWKPGVPYEATSEEVKEWVRLTGLTIYDGKLFASTGSCTSSVDDAPCDVRGKVFAMEAGKVASYDDDLGPGWKHLVAMREGDRLKLFIDGKLAATSSAFDPSDFDVSTDKSLRIGFGQTDFFAGKMSDVRIYNRALTTAAIQSLAKRSPTAAITKHASIVVGAHASRVDRFAATELQRCLTAALGWNVSISDAAPSTDGQPVFFVGSLDSEVLSVPGAPAVSEEQIAELREDGVSLKGDGETVALVGKGTRGSLNAVYHFLEQHVGVHWPEPGNERIPRLDSLRLEIDEVHNPTFCYRGVALHGPCSDEFHRRIIDWLAKNRLNSLQFSCEIYDKLRPKILGAVLDRGLSPKIGAHSRQYFYSSEAYFPLHPEHFSLVNGKRTGATQLCYSNHASVAAYADNVVDYLNAHPEISVVGLWPSDGYGFCECERCKAGSTTDVLLDYLNDVSERIHAHVPRAKVEFLSYIHYTAPPEKVKPLPYLVPTYCEYHSRNQFHPITEERASNAKCRRELESWVQQSNQATVYSYYADDVIKKFLYNPVPDVVLADLRYYQGIGVAGNSVLMMNPQSWWAHAPHMYAYARAAWNSSITLNAINDDYFTSMYGPAADAMRAHQQATRELFDGQFGHGQTGEEMLSAFRIKRFHLDQEESSRMQFAGVVDRMRRRLGDAQTASSDPYVLEKIAILDQDADLMAMIYGILSEAAGYKVDKNDARKDRIRALMARVGANDVVVKEDVRCNILKSLLPHVSSVLGSDEAARYDRVAIMPPE